MCQDCSEGGDEARPVKLFGPGLVHDCPVLGQAGRQREGSTVSGRGPGLPEASQRLVHHGQGAFPLGAGKMQGGAPGPLSANCSRPCSGELRQPAERQGGPRAVVPCSRVAIPSSVRVLGPASGLDASCCAAVAAGTELRGHQRCLGFHAASARSDQHDVALSPVFRITDYAELTVAARALQPDGRALSLSEGRDPVPRRVYILRTRVGEPASPARRATRHLGARQAASGCHAGLSATELEVHEGRGCGSLEGLCPHQRTEVEGRAGRG
mmetsp:Transcript_24765/g.58803  ORF Transcript_24765/g.58803 Transcript_24765/m.58803 type:complete len:269 (-) Transcript_24765:662-1468(-)